jgi:hypothetical protein
VTDGYNGPHWGLAGGSLLRRDCPLCLREIKLLRWLDRKRHIRFTNIAAPDFQATVFGETPASLMDETHGRLPDADGSQARISCRFGAATFLYRAVNAPSAINPPASS